MCKNAPYTVLILEKSSTSIASKKKKAKGKRVDVKASNSFPLWVERSSRWWSRKRRKTPVLVEAKFLAT